MKNCIVWFILITVLVLESVGCSTEAQYTPTRSRQLTDSTLDLKERWRHSQVLLGGYKYESHLIVSSGRVISRRVDFESTFNSLQVFDAANGKLLWEVSGKQLEGAGPLAADAERVYVMAQFEIMAYDLSDGQQLWKTLKLPDHRSYTLLVDGERLYVHDLTNLIAYCFNVHTGIREGSAGLSASDGLVLLAQLPEFDLYMSQTVLKAVDKTTQQLLWVTGVKNVAPVRWHPVLLADDMLVVGLDAPQIVAFDATTGQMEWQSQNIYFASNFVVANKAIYALDINARLVQLDLKTGQETGYIQFVPAHTYSQERRYWIATDGQMFLISFDDSQELIALEPP